MRLPFKLISIIVGVTGLLGACQKSEMFLPEDARGSSIVSICKDGRKVFEVDETGRRWIMNSSGVFEGWIKVENLSSVCRV